MLFSFTLLCLALSGLISAQISSPGCGRRPLASVANKIVNGTVAIPGDWAWNVALYNNGRFFCGGSLINDYYVISAGHCFSSNLVSSLQSVEIGVHNRNNRESWVQVRKISRIFIHESYSGTTLYNDISLIRLMTPAIFDDTYIIPVCLDETTATDPDFNLLDPQNKVHWLSGWGAQFYGGSVTVTKNQVQMTVLPDTRCTQRYQPNYNSAMQVCAGENNASNGACQGDSGGPLVQQSSKDGKWYLIGGISWGYSCGMGTVFTRIKYHMNWIRNKIALG